MTQEPGNDKDLQRNDSDKPHEEKLEEQQKSDPQITELHNFFKSDEEKEPKDQVDPDPAGRKD